MQKKNESWLSHDTPCYFLFFFIKLGPESTESGKNNDEVKLIFCGTEALVKTLALNMGTDCLKQLFRIVTLLLPTELTC